MTRPSSRSALPSAEARRLLAARGVRFPRNASVPSARAVARAAARLRPPYVVKLLSPQVLHKTEFGAVALGLPSPAAAGRAAAAMAKSVASALPGFRLDGFLVEEQAPAGLAEIVVGGVRDPDFGPAVMVGHGGTAVELFRDVAWRLAPISAREAADALRSLRCFPLLDGWRGKPRADLAALAGIVRAAASLLLEEPRVVEVDVNPVLAYPDGAVAVDARVLVRASAGGRRRDPAGS